MEHLHQKAHSSFYPVTTHVPRRDRGSFYIIFLGTKPLLQITRSDDTNTWLSRWGFSGHLPNYYLSKIAVFFFPLRLLAKNCWASSLPISSNSMLSWLNPCSSMSISLEGDDDLFQFIVGFYIYYYANLTWLCSKSIQLH